MGTSSSGHGVVAVSTAANGRGVIGIAENGSSAMGVYGQSSTGYAGFFNGDVLIGGELINAFGSSKIDHPLDPANKYLSHSFVDSPEMMNIYNGNVTTDEEGTATVTLPAYFAALNRDFRYQLTVLGQFAQAMVSEEINDNRFTIKTDKPHVKVSWQVTGIRQDAYANLHRVRVEEEKAGIERGHYLHPEAFGQPNERGVEWAHRPELIRKIKEQQAPR